MTPERGGALALGNAVAALSKVAEGGEVAEGRALESIFAAQAGQRSWRPGLRWVVAMGQGTEHRYRKSA